MNKRVIVASDSTCDLSPELIDRYQIKILPLGVTLSDRLYQDGVDIDPDMIYKHYGKCGELPKTSAPNISEFTEFFGKYVSADTAMVFFTISAEMSSTFNNARLAAAEFDDVYVIDTRNLSTGGGLLVISAAVMAAEGRSADEIARECSDMRQRVEASFVIDNLEFLHKGGRCSAVAALGANILQLKPCIKVKDGKMSVAKKYRGSFSSTLTRYIKDQIGDGSDIELDRVFITHAGCDDAICKQCIEQVQELAPFKEVFFTRAGCTVSAHCGKNTLGVLFIRKHTVQ